MNRWLPSVLIVGSALLLWEGLCSQAQCALMPAPHRLLASAIELLRNGSLVLDVAASLRRVAAGVALGTALGAALAMAAVTSRALHAAIVPFVELLRPIPPVALVPLAILWFGLGDPPALFLVAFGAAFPVFSAMFTGLTTVRASHVEAAVCLGASRVMLMRRVLLPAALPQILSGLRVGLGTGWFCVIVAELVGAQEGLGYGVQLSRVTLQMERMLVYIAAIGLLGYAMGRCVWWCESSLTKWRAQPSEQLR